MPQQNKRCALSAASIAWYHMHGCCCIYKTGLSKYVVTCRFYALVWGAVLVSASLLPTFRHFRESCTATAFGKLYALSLMRFCLHHARGCGFTA